MGDVAGHGLPAAVIMGRLRSALRAYALEHANPAEVLRLLDMKISYFEDGAVATVLYAVAEPPYSSFVVSSAGHLPPYLVSADGAVRAGDVPPDPPLGVRSLSDEPWTRHAATVNCRSGSRCACSPTAWSNAARPPVSSAMISSATASPAWPARYNPATPRPRATRSSTHSSAT